MNILKEYPIYGKSLKVCGDVTVYASQVGNVDYFVASGTDKFEGKKIERNGVEYTLLDRNHFNAIMLRALFPFTAPTPVLKKPCSIGVGDRLGIACDGHIELFSHYFVAPVLAQQSIRELTLTNRTYADVLDCVTYAVFKHDFQRGFGADGDHLKTYSEIEYALKEGYTMITLDCSDHIGKGTVDDEKAKEFVGTIQIGETRMEIGLDDVRQMQILYDDAIEFVCKVYDKYIKEANVDFEISIDETATVTTPAQHYYVAKRLNDCKVKFDTLAPRFVGEFQKGVDYRGDEKEFEVQLAQHNEIAKEFGYKISVHSGSDKFKVFDAVGRITQGRFHLKTAGTNWLEAVKLIAMKDPALYREIHTFALSVFDQATKYYHVSTDLNKIPALDTLSDEQLPQLFALDDARQLIHITYGLILQAKDAQGQFVYKDRMYSFWQKYREDYAKLLIEHIGAHLNGLNCKRI